MNELELIIDLHKNSSRQGPGSEEETLRALAFMDLPKDKALRIADIGCGSGGQTLTLAGNLDAKIIAVDIFPEFLEELNEKAAIRSLDKKITTIRASMEELPFKKEEFDIIWSEGAIYNMGFENGIKSWWQFIRPGGYLAVSEITWTSNSRPSELENFWKAEYPEIDKASVKIGILESNGYSLAGYFILSEKSWLENYYEPLEGQFEGFLKRNGKSEQANKVVSEYRAEIDIYKKFGSYYSYGFYVARKN